MNPVWLVPIIIVVGGLIALRVVTKKRIFTAFLVVAVLAVAFLGWRVMRQQNQPDPLANGEVYTVARGSVSQVVEATGNLAPVNQATLTFSAAGKLTELYVSTGDQVTAGQIVAVLDRTDLQLQLAQAQAQVDSAEANLNKLLASVRPEDVSVAESSLNQAVANRDQQRVANSAATEQARLSWEQAANNLRDAQANYSSIYWDNRELEDKLADIDKTLPQENIDAEAAAWRAVENAESAMEEARLSYEAAKQREASTNQSSNAQVSSAQASLEKVSNGVSDPDIAVAQASINQARASYEIARAQLDKAELDAPFAGLVGTVSASVYDQVSQASPILLLFDPSAFIVDVEVDEVDIVQVVVGQQVDITFDALPDVILPGRVQEIALTPTAGQGVVTYRVRIELTDLQGMDLRPGMTVNANIVTRQTDNVLVVPRRAVRLEDGQAYVDRVTADNQLETILVEMGLESPTLVEITSGLQEGDRVFIRSVVQDTFSRMFQMR